MQTVIILTLIYFSGVVLSYLMARTEIASEKEPYTFGSRLLTISFSLLSFIFVFIMLITAWIKQINNTGFWNEKIKKDPLVIEQKLSTKKTQLN